MMLCVFSKIVLNDSVQKYEPKWSYESILYLIFIKLVMLDFLYLFMLFQE